MLTFFTRPSARLAAPAALGAVLTTGICGKASGQVLDRYFPANVPAYQDWVEAAAPPLVDSIYGPLGVRVGSFVVEPSVTQTIEYDSNPFGSAHGNGSPVSDTNGAVAVNSDWERNAVNAAVTVDHAQYLSYPHQSYTTWTATTGGVVKYGDDEIQAGYSHIDGVTLPTDVGAFGVTQPITDQVDDLRISDTIGPGRVSFVPALVGDLYQFSNSNGAAAAANGLYDRNALTASLTGGYEFSGGHNALIIVSDTLNGYTGGIADLRPANYNDISVLTGLEYRQSALLIYRVLVGYEERNSTGSGTNRGTIAAPAAEVDAVWKPSVLTTLTGKITQSLQNQATGTSQGLTETTFGLDVVQSVRRDLSLAGSVQYAQASFPSSSQVQSITTAGATATWSLTRNVAVSLQYIFTNADDNDVSSLRFTRQQVLLQARLQL